MTEQTTTRLHSFDEPAFDALRRKDLAAFVVTLVDNRILVTTPPCEQLGLRADTPAPLSVKAVTRAMGNALGHPPRLERIRLPNAFVPRQFSCAVLPSSIGPVVLFADPAAEPRAVETPMQTADPAAPSPQERPIRFTWEMDETGRFTAVSHPGGGLSPGLESWRGRSLSDLEETGALREVGPALAALENGGTFANVGLLSGHRPARRMEIGGVPLFDALRRRVGWRGFGLMWPPADGAAGAASEAAPGSLAPNVVPLRGGTLTARERTAFDEIARTLSDAIDGWPRGETPAVSPLQFEDPATAGDKTTSPGAAVTTLPAGSDEKVRFTPEPKEAIDGPSRGLPATAISWDDSLLDRLPIGLAVQQDGAIVFLNETLLAWLALEDLSAFERAGGFGSLLTRDAPGEPLRLRTLSGPADVDVRLIRGSWRGQPAVIHVLKLQENGARAPAVAGPDDASGRQAALDLFGFPLLVVSASGTLVQANGAAAALSGFPAEDLLGEPFTLLFALESQKSAVAMLDKALTEKGDCPPEILVARHRSGALQTVEATISRATGTPPGLCLALRVLAKEPARHAPSPVAEGQRIEGPELSGDAFADFTRRVSHGVRSPLTGILGFVESVRASAFGPLGNSRYSRQAEAAGLAAQQLLATLEDIESLAPSPPLQRTQRAEIAPVVASAAAYLAPAMKRRGQILRSDLCEGHVAALDADILAFVFRSVLEEAVRATPVGGQIHVSMSDSDAESPRLLIRDEGPTLTEPQIAQALSAFVPAKASDRFSSSGRPFRMARLASILKANGGELRLRRGVEHGMLCELLLPPTHP